MDPRLIVTVDENNENVDVEVHFAGGVDFSMSPTIRTGVDRMAIGRSR